MSVMLLLIATVSFLSREVQPSKVIDSRGVAHHMAVYHTVAAKHCANTSCVNGVVNVPSYLPDNLSNSYYSDGKTFESIFDTSSSSVVTYAVREPIGKASISFEVLTAGLLSIFEGHSLSVGYYDASLSRIISRIPTAAPSSSQVTLPSPFGGKILPNGTPTILTRI
ncbi:hypothetical protein [Flexibacterium corallicola]|uniref:hypothetical protein n=1 Tax=Flexibacterium corallicola TaxID=3037259 RepID=UPI00286FA45D|nr:hypothetical protein [Pseudovibrio sp. M1P-2-3]